MKRLHLWEHAALIVAAMPPETRKALEAEFGIAGTDAVRNNLELLGMTLAASGILDGLAFHRLAIQSLHCDEN